MLQDSELVSWIRLLTLTLRTPDPESLIGITNYRRAIELTNQRQTVIFKTNLSAPTALFQ